MVSNIVLTIGMFAFMAITLAIFSFAMRKMSMGRGDAAEKAGYVVGIFAGVFAALFVCSITITSIVGFFIIKIL